MLLFWHWGSTRRFRRLRTMMDCTIWNVPGRYWHELVNARIRQSFKKNVIWQRWWKLHDFDMMPKVPISFHVLNRRYWNIEVNVIYTSDAFPGPFISSFFSVATGATRDKLYLRRQLNFLSFRIWYLFNKWVLIGILTFFHRLNLFRQRL